MADCCFIHPVGFPLASSKYVLVVFQGIYISRIAEGGAASRDSTLRVGDRVLSVSTDNDTPPRVCVLLMFISIE